MDLLCQVIDLLKDRRNVAATEPGVTAMGLTQTLYAETPKEALGKAEQNVAKILLKLQVILTSPNPHLTLT